MNDGKRINRDEALFWLAMVAFGGVVLLVSKVLA